jgi:hypothetical protein
MLLRGRCIGSAKGVMRPDMLARLLGRANWLDTLMDWEARLEGRL